MSTFQALVRKEARDVRWTAWGTAIALAAMALLITWLMNRQHVAWDASSARLVTAVGIALGAALGGGAVAAELFAGDVTSKRVQTAALLPVGLGRIVAAKGAVVLAATTLMGLWMMAWCPAAMCFFGTEGAAYAAFAGVEDAPPAIALAVAVVAAVALFGVVLEHGLGAFAVALGFVLGGAIAVAKLMPWVEWGLVPNATSATVALLLVAALFAAATALAFVHGPIHLDRRVRRAVLGAGTAFAVLGTGGWAVAAIGAARAELEPGDSAARIQTVLASPDGKHAILFVGNARVDWNCHAWAVDLADGTIVPLPGRHRSFDRWTADGRVRLWEESSRGRESSRTADVIDLDTGEIASTRSDEQIESEAWTEGWARFQRMPGGFVVEWPERGIKRRMESAWEVRAAPMAGRFVVWLGGPRAKVVDLTTGVERDAKGNFWVGAEQWIDGGRALRYRTNGNKLRVLDVETGDDREITPPEGVLGLVSSGPYAVLQKSKERSEIIDLRDGRTVSGPWTQCGVAFVPGSDHLAIRFGGPYPTALVDCATGRESPIEPDPYGYGYPPNVVHALPDGTILLLRSAGGLDVIDATGKTVRTVVADYTTRVRRAPAGRRGDGAR